MKIGHSRFQAPPQGLFLGENKKPITFWAVFILGIVWGPYWHILPLAANLVFGFVLVVGVSILIYLKHREFVAKQLHQRETRLVEIVYLADGDPATSDIVKQLEQQAHASGFLTEILSGSEFIPGTMLSGAVIVIFVVNDKVVGQSKSRIPSNIEEYLYEEAQIRVHEGAFNGHRLNIVYTEEGRRRRGFLRVKYAVIGNAKTEKMCGCGSPQISVSQKIHNFMEEFNAHPLLSRCETFDSETLKGWFQELWREIGSKTVIDHSRSPNAEPLLGMTQFMTWLWACSCCDQLTIERSRQRPSIFPLSTWQLYTHVITGTKGRLERRLFSNLDDKKWWFETNYDSRAAVRRWIISQFHSHFLSLYHVLFLFPYRVFLSLFHLCQVHLPHPLRHPHLRHPNPPPPPAPVSVPDNHVSKALFKPYLFPASGHSDVMDSNAMSALFSQGGENDWIVNPHFHVCSSNHLLPSSEYFPFILEWIHRNTVATLSPSLPLPLPSSTPSSSKTEDLISLPQQPSTGSEEGAQGTLLVEVIEIGTKMKHYYMLPRSQHSDTLKSLAYHQSSPVKISKKDWSVDQFQALVASHVIIPKDYIELESQRWALLIQQGKLQMKRQGYVVFAEILNPMMFEYYRNYCKDLHVRLLEGSANKEFVTFNDESVARYFSQELTYFASEIAGEPVVPSSLPLIIWNGPGPGFFLHQDSSPPFDLTLDLVVDHSGPHSRSVNFISNSEDSKKVQVETLNLKIGESAMFKGAEKWHFGGPLPPAHSHTIVLFTWQFLRD